MKLKKILKITSITILSIVALLLLYLGCAYCFSRIEVNEEQSTNDEIDIYIITNGVHTDIVFPVRNNHIDWSEQINFEHTISNDSTAQYLGMGWGDKGFYLETPTWAYLKASVAFNAAFGLNTTAIHATYYKNMVEDESCKKISISNEQYKQLVEYVANSFQTDENGNYINIITDAQYGNTDAFYEANGKYSMLHTCNTWANNGLKACGQKACLWTPFDTGIFKIYESEEGDKLSVTQ